MQVFTNIRKHIGNTGDMGNVPIPNRLVEPVGTCEHRTHVCHFRGIPPLPIGWLKVEWSSIPPMFVTCDVFVVPCCPSLAWCVGSIILNCLERGQPKPRIVQVSLPIHYDIQIENIGLQ